ncbi:MAG: sigma-70 family RNA polymerase sigma factor [Phycisphaerae bacterium]|nr:sigma-70 family RNA polymerase sigma factor [Phycisphaerae bacterium]
MQTQQPPTTTSLLLAGLHDSANQAAWHEFHARYSPVLLAVARRLGLTESDAADVAQEALMCFLRDYQAGKYVRERGRLRTWLSSIVRFRVIDSFRKKQQGAAEVGLSAAGDVPSPEDMEALWDAEARQMMLRQALDEVRTSSRIDERTLRAFERAALDDVPVAIVAAELHISTDDVYQAKSRVSSRLREVVSRLEAVYEDA